MPSSLKDRMKAFQNASSPDAFEKNRTAPKKSAAAEISSAKRASSGSGKRSLFGRKSFTPTVTPEKTTPSKSPGKSPSKSKKKSPGKLSAAKIQAAAACMPEWVVAVEAPICPKKL